MGDIHGVRFKHALRWISSKQLAAVSRALTLICVSQYIVLSIITMYQCKNTKPMCSKIPNIDSKMIALCALEAGENSTWKALHCFKRAPDLRIE